MEIIEKDPEELIEYKKNSRIHTDGQIKQIIASINEFGFTNPILVNSDNRVIAGHGRLMAALKMKLDKVPCIVLSELTEAQERAYVIADNKIALNSAWDSNMLSLEMADLKDMDFDIELTGFSFGEIFKDKGSSTIAGDEEFLVVLKVKNESEQKIMFEEMVERGVECKIV